MNRKVCTPKRTGRSQTVLRSKMLWPTDRTRRCGCQRQLSFTKVMTMMRRSQTALRSKVLNRPFCIAKCFDLLTAQDGAVAKGNFRLRKSWPRCGGIATLRSKVLTILRLIGCGTKSHRYLILCCYEFLFIKLTNCVVEYELIIIWERR